MKKNTFVSKCLSLILISVLAFSVAGCRHNVNTASPKVVFANTLLAGAQSCDLVATGLAGANDAIEKLEGSDPEYYAKLKPWLQKIAHANDTAIVAIRAAKAGDTSVDWRAALIAIAAAAGTEDPAAFGFKNKDSQTAVKIGFASLQAALISVSASFGGK